MNDYLCILVSARPQTWSIDWAWGIPLVLVTVLIHVLGLGLIRRKTLNASSHAIRQHPTSVEA
ncbi:MAG: hypothetical protein JOZ33_13305 [Acidobacteriaceae bacterium]|nr:hypothetical protein [Acidobacteriaceae bacterium]